MDALRPEWCTAHGGAHAQAAPPEGNVTFRVCVVLQRLRLRHEALTRNPSAGAVMPAVPGGGVMTWSACVVCDQRGASDIPAVPTGVFVAHGLNHFSERCIVQFYAQVGIRHVHGDRASGWTCWYRRQ
jgi:hypothetical protein